MSTRRTIRRYAHELYPHPGEGVVQPLADAVPYLYARAVGLTVRGTDWFDLGRAPEDRRDENGQFRAEFRLSVARTMEMIAAGSAALHADALLQGLSGEEAWMWAEERACEESGEWIWERAVHYGVPVDRIKPYPIITEPDHHDHKGEPAPGGGHYINRVDGRESECEACTEPIEGDRA